MQEKQSKVYKRITGVVKSLSRKSTQHLRLAKHEKQLYLPNFNSACTQKLKDEVTFKLAVPITCYHSKNPGDACFWYDFYN